MLDRNLPGLHGDTVCRIVTDNDNTAMVLMLKVWTNADLFTKTVQVTIGRLRRKLGEPPAIRTILSVGYQIPTTIG